VNVEGVPTCVPCDDAVWLIGEHLEELARERLRSTSLARSRVDPVRKRLLFLGRRVGWGSDARLHRVRSTEGVPARPWAALNRTGGSRESLTGGGTTGDFAGRGLPQMPWHRRLLV